MIVIDELERPTGATYVFAALNLEEKRGNAMLSSNKTRVGWNSIVSRLALAAAVAVGGAGAAHSQAGLQYSVVTDGSGNVVGQLGGGAITLDSDGVNYNVPINTYTATPPGITMSPAAPAPTATSTTVTVKVAPSSLVATCTSSTVYNKKTGQCTDGRPPIKMVSISKVTSAAAQIPTVVCTAPKVPTYFTSWTCLVPAGFKLSLGL
ncbi:MAG: hypothetical protein K8S25_13840 [Alphaproteobacteria bacterium]|nr:hypothetical protein [Alphaproteobacteria bacterium]